MRHVRTRPVFSECTRPLASRTLRCWTTADSVMSNGLANSLTDAGPRHSRATTARRVGSPSAWNMRSRGVDWLSMCLSITACLDMASIACPMSAWRADVFLGPASAELFDERLGGGRIANLGPGNEIGEDIAALGPGARLFHEPV